ncbi:hypothetical protein [Clostridium estertheticum]|uniref:Uncharacterized protein n=1 Tax=Clostridium estertheticum subsp. estertheticum TaxID=1552 RepID=A0A1J0GD45_9CLOT|nr:hypothetical protein [Clostridium estertheticum]APC39273.1 hypothetical protein A7L45_03955 [Clostridium estertheticum subsp. estertheticum]MBZ9614724.1 hypothetical protein [Clostridium estertheticum subsp. laramiense]WAG74646.1 hypothetical protein LL032_04060 [Clostridium estertheticum]
MIIIFYGWVVTSLYPSAPNSADGGGSLWECAWYNNTITSVKLVGVNITYMDDSTASLDSNQVQYVIN